MSAPNDTALLDELSKMYRERSLECEAWMNGVADAVEPLGFDREAASGPADLLPGLQMLTELLDAGGAVCKRMLYGWHPSVTHRQWFRSSFVDGDVREPMTDAEAAFVDRGYAHRSRP